MKYSRLGLSACLLLLFFRFCRRWAQKGEGYGDLLTPQVRSDKLGARSICGTTWWTESCGSACAMPSF